MQDQILEAVGKVAGIGGIALGVFLLLFREVIRKNIFPKFSDDAAYRLIRQFMYLTFGIALFGLAAWTYISVITADRPKTTFQKREPSPDIAGLWTADVAYSWGKTHQEKFTFEMRDHEVSGTASYVTTPHPLIEGEIDGNRLRFQTTSLANAGAQNYVLKHRYRGTVSENRIEFTLETESEYEVPAPVKFTAFKSPTQNA